MTEQANNLNIMEKLIFTVEHKLILNTKSNEKQEKIIKKRIASF